jgi:hypothetical protein
MRVVVLAFAVALALPGGAHAARTFTVGKGHSPAVAVDAAGAAHLAWYQESGSVDRLRYCRIPLGATACRDARSFKGTGAAGYRTQGAFVFLDGDEVVLLSSFRRPLSAPVTHDHLVFRSADGGASFAIGVPTGDPDRSGAEVAAWDGSGFGLVGDGAEFTGTPTLGPPIRNRSAELSRLVSRPERVADPSIALVSGQEPIVTVDYLRDTVVFRTGGPGVLRSLFVENWIKASQTLLDHVQGKLASGPKGVYGLFTWAPDGRCRCSFSFRRWDGARFASPFDTVQDFAGTGAATGGNADLFQDAAGRLHAVWAKARGSGFAQDPTDIRYVRSPGGTARFGEPATVAARGRNTTPLDLDVATAKDGRGLVVWAEGARAGDSVIRATAVPGGK